MEVGDPEVRLELLDRPEAGVGVLNFLRRSSPLYQLAPGCWSRQRSLECVIQLLNKL